MCELRINFPKNFTENEASDILEFESVPVCGTCKNRDWCPVFIISVKKYTQNILKVYPTKTDAIMKMLFKKAKAQEAKATRYVAVCDGVIDMIKNNDILIKPLNINDGVLFMKDTFNNKDVLSMVKQLINDDSLKEIE